MFFYFVARLLFFKPMPNCVLLIWFGAPSKGSVAVVLPPLLCGSTGGGSLRADWRKLEDKLLNHKVELRPFCLNLNTTHIHQNRDLPSAYVSFLGVADSTLPNKGTAHRAVRGRADAADVAPAQVNTCLCLEHLNFCFNCVVIIVFSSGAVDEFIVLSNLNQVLPIAIMDEAILGELSRGN